METSTPTFIAPSVVNPTTVRMQSAFPIVGRIRKGEQKQKIKKEGREIEVMGKDLNDRFRLEFMPGTGAFQAAFYSAYETFQPNIIKALIPDTSVWNAFTWFNAAYLNRLVAKADDTKFISLIDPDTGKYIIRDGQPFRPFVPKEEIEYHTSSGKPIMLKIKSTSFLRLLLYTIPGQFVSYEIYSVSYYDRLNLTAQLAAIQGLANCLYNGNAGSIPLTIYRQEQEVNWTKGSSGTRIKKWLINVAPDSTWSERVAMPLLRERLGMSAAESMLTQPKPELKGNLNPDDEEEAPAAEGTTPVGTFLAGFTPERLIELTPHSPSDWTTFWNVSVPSLGATREQGLDAVENSKGAIHAFKLLVENLAASQGKSTEKAG